jgi:hypothetical protein
MRLWPQKSIPEITPEAYTRWLRAHRPPMSTFLGLSELEQESLAQVGDAHTLDVAVAIGHAVRDPDGVEALGAAQAGDMDAEADLAKRLIQGFAEAVASRGGAPAPSPDVAGYTTGAGFGQRRVRRFEDGRQNGTPEKAAEALFGLGEGCDA